MKIKQAASYQDQVRILKSKGLIIEDKNDCMQFLKHTNYYRFSAYCESFRYEGKGSVSLRELLLTRLEMCICLTRSLERGFLR